MQGIKKRKIIRIIVIFLLSFAFLSNDTIFAGVEDVLMPNADIIVKGKLPYDCTVDIDLILNDPSLNVVRMGDFAVWSQPIEVWTSCCGGVCDCAPYPPSLEILLAISENGLFFFGCEATLPDILSVFGTLSGGGDGGTSNSWRYDDCQFESKDIALVGKGYKIFKDLEGKGYVSEIYGIELFRNTYSIEVKHKLAKNVIVIYYPTYIYRGAEHTTIQNLYGIYTRNYGASFQMNERWCPFFSPFDNGTVTRSCRINYQGEIASYLYCSSYSNNGEESWIKLDDIEILRRTKCCRITKKFYNLYPQRIEFGGKKTWSEIRQSVTITVLADSVTVSDWTETPSLGQRKNPPPDILALEPNIWYGEYITYSTEDPMIGKEVNFNVSPLFDPNEIESYKWDFGDENTGEGANINHTYQEPGDYNISVIVTKTNGEKSKSSATITVKDFQLRRLNTIENTGVGFDIGDVDNDSELELVLTDTSNRQINVYDDKYNLEFSITFNEAPRVAQIHNIDDDDKNELIIGTATGSEYDGPGYAYIGEVDSKGNFTEEWKSPQYCLKWADELVVGDMNSNGKKELVMGLAGSDKKLVSYEYTGSTYSLIFTDNIGSDVDSVFVSEDKLFVGTSCTPDYGMRVYNNYNLEFSDLNDGSTCVSVGDLNSDGKTEIVRAIGSKCEYASSYNKYSYPRPVFSIYDETYTKVFTSTELSVDSVPRHVFVTTGELLPGGGEEIAVGICSEAHEIIDKIRVYRYNGTTYEEVWNDKLSDVTDDVYHLKIADLDGDGQNELFVSTNYGLLVYAPSVCSLDTFYQDADADGYGDPNIATVACTQPPGYVINNLDCNDIDPNINPNVSEACDGEDNNCNSQVDEDMSRGCSTDCGTGTETCQEGQWIGCSAPQPIPYYRDADHDGYGDLADMIYACDIPPLGYVGDNTDCNDHDFTINPNASEICYDEVDNDCDVAIDEDDCIACIFRAGIRATGQGQEHGVPGAYSISTVYIGMDEAASTYKTPAAPPNWTVYMKVSGNLNEDIRQIGSEREEWVLTVDIGEYADPNLDGYYPVLSWDTNEFCALVSTTKFRLYSEDAEGRLTLLIDDMHKTNSYQTKAEEGAECALGMCRLIYYIIWSKDILFEMNLPAGWTMISLPVKPDNLIASDLFPDAEVIYGFAKGTGYERLKEGEELEGGKGYWILLPEEQRYSLIGMEIDEYNLIVEDGWLMIGSCTSPSEAFIDKGTIEVIYGLNPSLGYQRVLASEKLKPGEGYWILFSDVIGQAELTVKSMENRSRLRAGTRDNKEVTERQWSGGEFQGEGWRLGITASGQDLPGASKVSTVYIGMDETAATYAIPGYLPNYTVNLKIFKDLLEDIRQIGYEREVWRLTVEIGEYAEPTLSGYYPVLSWDPDNIPGTMRLLSGNTNDGDILIYDMRECDFYKTQEADGEQILMYTIVFEPDSYTAYHRDTEDDNNSGFKNWRSEYIPYHFSVYPQLIWPYLYTNSYISENNYYGNPFWWLSYSPRQVEHENLWWQILVYPWAQFSAPYFPNEQLTGESRLFLIR